MPDADRLADLATGLEHDHALLKDSDRILALLHRAMETRALLGIALPRVLRVASSLLIGIDRSHRQLQLDAPLHILPPDAGSSVRVRTRIDGAPFEFVSDFVASDAASWIVGLPEETLYMQRRNTFRLRVTRLPGLIFTHFIDQQRRFRSRLLDISALGLSAQLDPGQDVPLGSEMECVIDLPDAPVSCRAEVRWRRRNSAGLHVGMLFHDLTQAQQKRLSLAIAVLQRQLLRRAA